MNYTVFYSWQSDLDNRFNRSFIQDALEKAARTISNDQSFALEAVIDRDTYGMPGSPSIVESITGKIAKSDVFVCDISIINSTSNDRQSPNPNVLYELGYASAILGWDRIILVQNTAFGGPEKLPFDLRGRRILPYFVDATLDNKAEEKQKLKQKLIETFKDAFTYYSSDFHIKEKVIWWGTWEMDSKIKVRGGKLHINRVSSDAFFFDLSIYDGSRTGEVSGKAQILTPHSAYTRIKTLGKENCEIIFRRRLEGDIWFIEVEEGPRCFSFHGLGATFSGAYKHATESVVNWGYLDEIDLNEIARLTGKYLSVFLNNFQQVHCDLDEYDNELTVISAGVKGLYTIMESIVILDQCGNVWCACLGPENDVVRYFTNVQNETQSRPKALQEWLSRFSDRQMIINYAPTQSMLFEEYIQSESKKLSKRSIGASFLTVTLQHFLKKIRNLLKTSE